MTLTPYQAKYFAHELTKKCSAVSMEKLAGALLDAQVDLNPHQVEAALFAFKSPLSNGAILADEVGLGKTIEAGLVLSQKWAENKRRILIITPASLRKQWSQELQEKFYLPSMLLESKTYRQAQKQGQPNPFEQTEIIICSYQFAARHVEDLMLVRWDLVVMDEAHRLRNVYKNGNKTARALRTALANAPKILLTATPLQNSLLELYGLVSFIDEYAFGDEKSFKAKYARLGAGASFDELKQRLKPVCHRTLRRQVLEYVPYTNRTPLTQEFTPTPEEQDLYDMVSDYLARPNLQALPAGQRKLMTLVMRKLLASSTFAIAGALDSLARKLHNQLNENRQLMQRLDDIGRDYELLDELEEEAGYDGEEENKSLSADDIAAIEKEIEDLEVFRDLAVSITENAKGEALLEALQAGFTKARELGAADKAILFTESRRTQDYLVQLLSDNGYADQLVLFNGSNSDKKSRQLYKDWQQQHQGSDRITGSRTADMRAALVDYFRDDARIMIATEAAAEGINLQFCSLVVNYDMPWNPQRIEQRIGRCHRYGQKHDVVVISFLNKANAADQRVYELLSEKFSLFSGVFGASDEVLGAIEGGIDFEQRIVAIYQHCRTPDAIELEFQQLRNELDSQISNAMQRTRQQLLENFDAEVHDKLRVNLKESQQYLDRYSNLLWELTRFGLQPFAQFQSDTHRFKLHSNPQPEQFIETGDYQLGKHIEGAHTYRLGHPLAQHVVNHCKQLETPPASLTFDYSNHPQNSIALEPFVGQSGTLICKQLSVTGAEQEDFLLLAGFTSNGQALPEEMMARLLNLPATASSQVMDKVELNKLDQALEAVKTDTLTVVEQRYGEWFEQEMEKLDRWADDKRRGLKDHLKKLNDELKELKKQIRQASSLPDKLKLQRQARKLESKRDQAWREFDSESQGVEKHKDDLLDTIEARLQMQLTESELFRVRWQLE